MAKKRLLIVGGVAGGASCAARARRLCEDAQITILERGPHTSYANCGLPYFVGGKIRRVEDLYLADPEFIEARYRADVRTDTEAVKILPDEKKVLATDTITGEKLEFSYDWLLLSPGAAPVRPDLPGIDLPGLFTVRTVQDSLAMNRWIKEKQPQTAVVVGAGYIGLEMAENLSRKGMSVHLVEMQGQVLPAMDPEIASVVARRLQKKGVTLHLNAAVEGFEEKDGAI
ncbi:MAG: FAD-dependent oxidoreductase, partial [Deltaproteobacteria bacterium]|nr:FAD-dependent oxidoreductase [Deltaproteobacteria bacterium]